jgi:exodeoxyribonuclease VII small subunit
VSANEASVPVGDLSFTEASRELDSIVAYFERNDLDVDQLVVQLERATAIVDELDRRLRRTRAQVEELVPKLESAIGVDRSEPDQSVDNGQLEEAGDDDASDDAPKMPGLFS